MIRFDFDETRCTACGACAVACMDQNDIDTEAGQRPYRRVRALEEDGAFLSLSLACLHCPDAPCADACPMGCLFKDPDTGLTDWDNTNCVGCRACDRACPWHTLSFRPTGKSSVRMEKCHGCRGRVEAGLLPACVRACPTGALTLRSDEDAAARERLAALFRRCPPPDQGAGTTR